MCDPCLYEKLIDIYIWSCIFIVLGLNVAYYMGHTAGRQKEAAEHFEEESEK